MEYISNLSSIFKSGFSLSSSSTRSDYFFFQTFIHFSKFMRPIQSNRFDDLQIAKIITVRMDNDGCLLETL